MSECMLLLSLWVRLIFAWHDLQFHPFFSRWRDLVLGYGWAFLFWHMVENFKMDGGRIAVCCSFLVWENWDLMRGLACHGDCWEILLEALSCHLTHENCVLRSLFLRYSTLPTVLCHTALATCGALSPHHIMVLARSYYFLKWAW